MMFNPGDKVDFLNEIGGGEVVEVVSSEKVVVRNEHGFNETHSTKELVIKQEAENLHRVYDIDESTIKQIRSHDLQSARPSSPRKSEKETIEVMEIDLHIHEILDNTQGLNNYDIIRLQLDHCERALEKAMRNNIKKLIIIHGVGQGVLKGKVTHLLNQYPGISYFDAPYRDYGFGATEVRL